MRKLFYLVILLRRYPHKRKISEVYGRFQIYISNDGWICAAYLPCPLSGTVSSCYKIIKSDAWRCSHTWHLYWILSSIGLHGLYWAFWGLHFIRLHCYWSNVGHRWSLGLIHLLLLQDVQRASQALYNVFSMLWHYIFILSRFQASIRFDNSLKTRIYCHSSLCLWILFSLLHDGLGFNKIEH